MRNCEIGRYTSHSLINRSQTGEAIARARLQGYVVVVDEFEAGVTGLSVPIGRQGELRAVVGTSLPSADITGEAPRTRVLRALNDLAREMLHTRMFRQS